MKKIDTSHWREFALKDLGFKNYHGTRITKKERQDGDKIFITAGKENRGIVCTIGNDIEIWHKPITIDMFGNSFYHNYDCCGDDNIYAFVNTELSDYVKWFIASVINAENNVSFSYKDQFRQDNADELAVILPATANGTPDWQYMEDYMRAVEQKVQKALHYHSAIIQKPFKAVNIDEWGEFAIGELFDVRKGKRLTKKDMNEGDIRYIGASAENNGITAYISNNQYIQAANTITVCYNGSVGESFYQEKEFWASDDVNVLYPKFEMSKAIAMFLLPIIKKVGKNYAFIDKWKKETMEMDKIKLPATPNGTPDWEYIEQYMQRIEAETQQRLDLLTKT